MLVYDPIGAFEDSRVRTVERREQAEADRLDRAFRGGHRSIAAPARSRVGEARIGLGERRCGRGALVDRAATRVSGDA